ncbi:Uncharacterised protein [Mycobacteroides abscessus subsp. abscessus]|nr:Uncharacterised protein [Mycobacteroides abscessus subsp. abscessus]
MARIGQCEVNVGQGRGMKVGMGAVERIGQSREAIGGQCREQPAAVAKVVRGRGMRDTRFAGQLPQ